MIEVVIKITDKFGEQTIKFDMENVDIEQEKDTDNDVVIVIKGKLAKTYDN